MQPSERDGVDDPVRPHGYTVTGTRFNQRFMTTQWTRILAAGGNGPDRLEALNWLCSCYWYPIYGFVRRRGYGPEDAADLTQGFLTRLIERKAFTNLNREGARFSTWLLVALKNHLSHEWSKDQSAKRGRGQVPLSLDMLQAESWYLSDRSQAADPDAYFDQDWAQATVEAAVTRLAQEADRNGKAALFHALQPFLMREPECGEYDRLSAELGLKPGTLGVNVFRLRQKFRDALCAEIEAGGGPVEEGLRELRDILIRR